MDPREWVSRAGVDGVALTVSSIYLGHVKFYIIKEFDSISFVSYSGNIVVEDGGLLDRWNGHWVDWTHLYVLIVLYMTHMTHAI